MGMRAIAEIAGVQHYLQWGSPAYQVEAFATWLHACANIGARPTAANYRALTNALSFGIGSFQEVVTGPLPMDLDWTYAVDVDGTDASWTVAFDVRGPQLWRELGDEMALHAGPVDFRCTVSHDHLAPLDAIVATKASRMAVTMAHNEVEATLWRRMAQRWAA